MRRDIIIGEEQAGRSLRSALVELLPDITAKSIRKNIQRGQITVNTQRVHSNHVVQAGDLVKIHIQTSWQPISIPIRIVYEDDHIAIVDKPTGLLTNDPRKASLVNAVRDQFSPSRSPDKLLSPVPMHRLDKDTSGLVLFCKTKSAVASLSDQFEARTIVKLYKAIAVGNVPAPKRIEKDIDKKTAITEILHSDFDGAVSHLLLRLHTGRKNQIRLHLASERNPILGDRKFHKSTKESLKLCAVTIEFKHPESGMPITVSIEPPF